MIDKAVATLAFENGKVIGDYEFPTGTKILDIKAILLKGLQADFPRDFAGISEIIMSVNGSELLDEETFASRGVWDGSIIYIRTRR